MNGDDISKLMVAMTEMKGTIDLILQKVDLKFKPIDEHLKESPKFRDKISGVSAQVVIMWPLIVLILSGLIGGFFWMLRAK